MMLSTNLTSLSSYPQYMPQRPSPLSPRSVNVRSRSPLLPLGKMSMSEPKCRESKQAGQRNTTNGFASYRRNPLIKSSEERTKLRRNAYLDRVKTGQEDQRWGSKSDQILHLDYTNERRRWEEELQRTAPEFEDVDNLENQENHLPITSCDTSEHVPMSNTFSHSVQPWSMKHTVFDEVEAVAYQEEKELEELLALAEDEKSSVQEPRSERWGSDEEDYDDIFMEFMSSSEIPQQAPSSIHDETAIDTMDTSMD